MDDENLITCLSTERHDDNIKDHIAHFLGCIEVSERDRFLNDDDYPLWQKELEHYRKTDPNGAEELTSEKRKRWMSDCQSELRRVDFLREKLSGDEEDRHLVRKLDESRLAWKQSPEFNEGLRKVQAWKQAIGKIQDPPKPLYEARNAAESKYKSEKDINVPFMYFRNFTHDNEEVVPGIPVWGKFPDQKTTVDHLDKDLGGKNLLSKDRLPEHIRYFHLPSNNMLVRLAHEDQ